MYREIHDVLLEQMREPRTPLIYSCTTEACLDAYGETAFFCGCDQGCTEFVITDKSTTAALLDDRLVRTAHIYINTFVALFGESVRHMREVFRTISPNLGNHWVLIFSKSEATTSAMGAFFTGVACRIGKLSKKYIRFCS